MDIKNTPYWSIFAETFKVFRDAFPVQESDKYWTELSEKAVEVAQEYEGTEYAAFANAQLISVLEELGRICKSKGVST